MCVLFGMLQISAMPEYTTVCLIVCLFVCLCILHQSCLIVTPRDSQLSCIRGIGFQSTPT